MYNLLINREANVPYDTFHDTINWSSRIYTAVRSLEKKNATDGIVDLSKMALLYFTALRLPKSFLYDDTSKAMSDK
jgi:hypothetical protein